MDTEEHIEIQKAIMNGHPETDEGPYYHDSWWESYKGGVKGKLGGAVIGALIGAAMGGIACILPFLIPGLPAVGTLAAGGLIASFAAGGMMYGAHEFSEVGKITGSNAAIAEKQEERMNPKFAELKKGIEDIKAVLSGKKAPETLAAQDTNEASVDKNALDYRTQHCNDGHCPTKNREWVFWKIAAIGLVIGAAAGALLASGPGAGEILGMIVGESAKSLSTGAIFATSMTTLGLFGASFGINRDIFREIFDRTDHLFKGILSMGRSHAPEIAQAQNVSTPTKPNQNISTIVYDSIPDYPKSDTFHRDKVLASAKQALLSMDHTKSVPH